MLLETQEGVMVRKKNGVNCCFLLWRKLVAMSVKLTFQMNTNGAIEHTHAFSLLSFYSIWVWEILKHLHDTVTQNLWFLLFLQKNDQEPRRESIKTTERYAVVYLQRYQVSRIPVSGNICVVHIDRHTKKERDRKSTTGTFKNIAEVFSKRATSCILKASIFYPAFSFTVCLWQNKLLLLLLSLSSERKVLKQRKP